MASVETRTQLDTVCQLNDRGIAARGAGNLAEAMQWHHKAAELAKDLPEGSLFRLLADIVWRLGTGNTLLEFNQPEEALQHLQVARDLAMTLESAVEGQGVLNKALSSLARCLVALGRLEDALSTCHRYRISARHDDDAARQAEACAIAGEILYQLGEYEDAKPLIVEARNLFEACGDRESTARAQAFLTYTQGQLGFHSGETDSEAVDVKPTLAEDTFRLMKVTALLDKGHTEQALALAAIIDSPLMKEFVRAMVEAQAGGPHKSLEILESLSGTDAFRQTPEAFQQMVRFQKGVRLRELGRADEALKIYNQVIGFFEQTGPISAVAFGSPVKVTLYAERAVAHQELGQFLDSLADCEKALAIANSDRLRANILLTKGATERRMGLHASAIDSCKSALAYFQEMGYRHGEGLALHNLGTCLLEEDALDQAEACFRQSLQALQEGGKHAPLPVGRAYAGLSQCAKARGDFEHSREHLEKTYASFKEGNSLKDVAAALVGLIDLDQRLGASSCADARREELEDIADHIWDPLVAREIHRVQAEDARRTGDLGRAITELEQAAEVDELALLHTMGDFHTAMLSSKRPTIYSNWIDLLLEDKQYEAAFDIAERARARSLVLTLGGGIDDPPEAAPVALIAAENEALAELRKLQRSTFFTRSGAAQAWSEARSRLQAAYRQMEGDPVLRGYVQMRRSLTLPLSRIRKIAGATLNHTALVALFQQRERVIAFILAPTADCPVPLCLSLTAEEATQLARGFKVAFEAYSQVDIEEALHEAEKRFAPLLEALPDVHPLLIVPHGPLFGIPFHALRVGAKRQHLLTRQPVCYLPALSILPYCLNFAHARKKCLAVGVDFEREAEIVASKFKQYPALCGDRARIDVIKRLAANVDVLHFSCHGLPLRGVGGLDALKVGGGERLTLRDAFAFNLHADLIVLAACHSGAGIMLSPDEVIGMARGFIFAGAASIVSALWPVENKASIELIRRFYDYLAAGQGKAQALCNAQKDLSQSTDRHHPLFWAPYSLLGDGGPYQTHLGQL